MKDATFQAKVIDAVRLTKNVYDFAFHKDADFSFQPGQYVEITFPDVSPFPTREFTICSSPLDTKVFHIVTKEGETPFKKQLLAIHVGKHVAMRGPLGGFIFDENDKRERVYISGGLGITPFYSMIRYASQKNIAIPMTLIASFRKKEDFLFHEEFQHMMRQNNNIRVVFVASETEGRISQKLLQSYISDFSKSLYYIAGPNKMVDDMEELLETMKIQTNQIRVEYFNGYQSVE